MAPLRPHVKGWKSFVLLTEQTAGLRSPTSPFVIQNMVPKSLQLSFRNLLLPSPMQWLNSFCHGAYYTGPVVDFHGNGDPARLFNPAGSYQQSSSSYVQRHFRSQPDILRPFENLTDKFIRTRDKGTFDGGPVLIYVFMRVVLSFIQSVQQEIFPNTGWHLVRGDSVLRVNFYPPVRTYSSNTQAQIRVLLNLLKVAIGTTWLDVRNQWDETQLTLCRYATDQSVDNDEVNIRPSELFLRFTLTFNITQF